MTKLLLSYEVFAIRHKPTGRFMPARMFRTANRGWSHWDPFEQDPDLQPYDSKPRLFFSRHKAGCALGKWLSGKWETKISSSDNPLWGRDDRVGTIATRPRNERLPDDMEIVPFHLEEQPI